MSNRERAADLITTWQARHKTEMDNNTDWAAQNLAGDLADAGLLAPDLPEPQEHGGEIIWPVQDPDGWVVSLHDGWVRLSDERGAIFTASRKLARDLAHIFLAAANETEKRA